MSRRDKGKAGKEQERVDVETKDAVVEEPVESAESQAGQADEVEVLKAEIDSLKAGLEEKDKEIAELKDKYLRTVAESDNIRKRIRQQSEETVRLQREGLLRDLLPIIDNLERAVAAAEGGGNGKSIVEGVQMVLASILDLLKQQGVTPEQSVGRRFDPACHEAIDQVPSDTHPPNTVVQEFHRGYRIGDRMLRHARVVVAKGSENPDSGESDKSAD